MNSATKSKLVKFVAAEGSDLTDGQVNAYGMEIFNLQKAKDEPITAEEVLADARNPSTAYHGYFVWDNDVAGEKYRQIQASQLLTGIKIVIDDHAGKPKYVRAFYNVTLGGKKGYMPASFVFNNEMAAQQVINQALKEARSWSEKYRIYAELSPISRKIDEIIGKYEQVGQ
jgi:hypothetical protein